MPDRARARAWLCVAGVALLTAAWVLGGLLTPGFDPVRQSISQLQREGTATSAVLTAAFVAFAVGAAAFAPLLPRLPGEAARSLTGRARAVTLAARHVTSGLLQRAGFLTTHLWLAGTALRRA